jgi:hypothetical protein
MVLATLLLATIALSWLLVLELALWSTYELAEERLHRFAQAWTVVLLEWWRWWRRREVWIVILLSLAILPAAGCVVSAETRTRTALDALADVVNPAWHLAEEACVARQETVAAREKAGLLKPAETDAAFVSIRQECDAVTATFEAIRAAHAEARKRVNAGDVKQAEALVDDIRAKWRALGGGS